MLCINLRWDSSMSCFAANSVTGTVSVWICHTFSGKSLNCPDKRVTLCFQWKLAQILSLSLSYWLELIIQPQISKLQKKSSDQNQLIFHFIHQDQCRWNRQILLSGSFPYFLSCMYTLMLKGHFKLCKVSNNGWFWIVNHGTLLCQKLGIILSPHWTDCIQHLNSTVSFTERKQMDIMAVRNFLIFPLRYFLHI